MNARDSLVATLTAEELAQAMVDTSDRIKWCRSTLDIGRVALHSRWMDALLDEWTRRNGRGLGRAG